MSLTKPLHRFIGTPQRDRSAFWTSKFGCWMLARNKVTGDPYKLRELLDEFKLEEPVPSDLEERMIKVLTR